MIITTIHSDIEKEKTITITIKEYIELKTKCFNHTQLGNITINEHSLNETIATIFKIGEFVVWNSALISVIGICLWMNHYISDSTLTTKNFVKVANGIIDVHNEQNKLTRVWEIKSQDGKTRIEKQTFLKFENGPDKWKPIKI